MLSHEKLERISRAYGLADVQASPLSGRVHRLRSSTGTLAAKIFPAGEGCLAGVEAELLQHLANGDDRYVVPTVFPTVADEGIFHSEDESYLLTEWEEGTFKRYTEFTVRDWEALGRSLGALHMRLDEWPSTVSLTRLSTILSSRQLDKERETIERQRAISLRRDASLGRYFDDRLLLLDECADRSCVQAPPEDPEQPIHNDYNQYNYLFRDSDPPLILDWEASIGAPREYEIVRCLNHLPLVQPDMAHRFLRAYVEVRSIERDKLAWAVDVALMEHALKHWLIDAWLRHDSGAAELLTGSVQMIRTLTRERHRLREFFLENLWESHERTEDPHLSASART